MKKLPAILVLFSTCAFVAPSQAGDVDAGKSKALVCLACHGLDGIGTQPAYPNIRGQKEVYLIKQLKAFRDGQRKDPIMTPMAQPLTDSDIENLAAYYSNFN